MSTWAEMKEEGWQLLRVDEQKGSGDKRKVFLAPARKGKRKPVSRKNIYLAEGRIYIPAGQGVDFLAVDVLDASLLLP